MKERYRGVLSGYDDVPGSAGSQGAGSPSVREPAENAIPPPGVVPAALSNVYEPPWADPDGPVQHVSREGKRWRLGTPADVAWITEHTQPGMTINAAIPPVFEAYATIVLADGDSPDGSVSAERARQEGGVMTALRAHAATDSWWLGYLETGADDVVFPDAPRVALYAHWPYVMVLAGPDQAASWRQTGMTSFWGGVLPNLMFPADRSWLVSALWDDDWACVGGPAALIDQVLADPVLGADARRVFPGADATPPGYTTI